MLVIGRTELDKIINYTAIFYFSVDLTLIINVLRYRIFSFIIWLIMHNIESFIRNDAFTITYFNSKFNTVTVAGNSENLVLVPFKIE